MNLFNFLSVFNCFYNCDENWIVLSLIFVVLFCFVIGLVLWNEGSYGFENE